MDRLKCKICNKEYASSYTLKRHIETFHKKGNNNSNIQPSNHINNSNQVANGENEEKFKKRERAPNIKFWKEIIKESITNMKIEKEDENNGKSASDDNESDDDEFFEEPKINDLVEKVKEKVRKIHELCSEYKQEPIMHGILVDIEDAQKRYATGAGMLPEFAAEELTWEKWKPVIKKQVTIVHHKNNNGREVAEDSDEETNNN